jgi:iron complex transport system substrate-binding protein
MTRSNRTTKALVAVIALAAAAAAVAGCAAKPAAPPAKPAEKPAPTATFPVTITDDTSRSVTVAAKPERIVSLAPANTEILFAIGAGPRVVGVTTYDDYPAEVSSIEKVGDFVSPNFEKIAAAKPDLVIATTGVQADAIKKLEDLGATVIAVDPQSLDALYADIAEIGQATGEVAGAEKTVADMKAAVADIENAVSATEKTTAFIEIGQNPLYTVGSGVLLDELVRVAGGTNVVTEPGFVPYSTEKLIKSDPQVYLATKGSSSDPSAITSRAGYKDLQAVKGGHIVILDDNLVSRPGPRIVEGLRQIAQGLHPDASAK